MSITILFSSGTGSGVRVDDDRDLICRKGCRGANPWKNHGIRSFREKGLKYNDICGILTQIKEESGYPLSSF